MRAVAIRVALRRTAWASWVGLLALGLWLVLVDRRPDPIFPDQFTHPDASAVFVTALLPLELTFALPERPSAVRVPVWVEPGRRPLELRLRVTPIGAAGAVEAGSIARITASGLARVEGAAGPPSAVTVRLSITSDARSREQAPSVLWSRDAARIPLEVRYAGKPFETVRVLPDTGPLFLLEYPWPTRWLLVLWFGVAGLLPLAARRDSRLRASWLAVLALAAALTSALLWQRDYTRRAAHLDADRYAESAERMADYIREPATRAQTVAWFRDYPHSSTQLVSALLVPFVLLGGSTPFAYALLSALAAWLALLAFHRVAVAQLRLSAGVALAVTAALACHPLMLRSFARPVTDSVGLLLVVLTLASLLRRTRILDRRDEILLAGLVFLHPLARPQGFGYWPFIALAIVWADVVREGGWPGMRRMAIRGASVFAAPSLALAALYTHFDWVHNVELMLVKARRFRVDATPGDLLASLVGVVQALPLLALLTRRPGSVRLRSDPGFRLIVAWALYAVGMLILVRAPFWLRHFLPVLPVAFWLAGLWLRDLRGTRRRLGFALLIALAVANVAVTLWQVLHLESLPTWLAAVVAVP